MLIISLLTHVQYCIVRYQTRKALATVSAAQMQDMGLSHEACQAELSKASIMGFVSNLTHTKRKGEAS
ncbi:hypothetical protein [Marinomonas pollencensis]|uniref:DUF1127 domain-containing protein n=1 Tax=Marinomonas pollencensis TaxID=491954 RepID=A0A3E0DV96_9GAMM|nr:hypothetical protein [Marinomonas pollencensis]REG86828.1 hypothetical protein DFP81_101397 [Marinomonas pollencensis]